ncbi:hypothetical protein Y032_0028g1717 [Ancylostoma ceylanicum]|uniref:HDAg domain-containing protein n=3 Tax=Ancylostoma TaxID=29169 RepID=A0A016USM0_9BILA|nr:hypothetical protein Y032_0028g1717 [Ancylostoma ceylanicum]
MADPGRTGVYFPSSSQASTLKDMDLVNWLEKKLNDAGVWSGRMTASMLSREMLEELETCFQAIDVQTKLKIICCIPHMNPRKMSMTHAALTTLLDLASKDADDWVETIADMYRDITSTGVIIPVSTNKDSHFAKTLDDLTKCFQRHLEAGNLKLTPEGHNIASTSVNKASFGAAPELQKCFILRKKPKSFNLSNEMTKQCAKLADTNRERNSGLWSASVPIKIRSTLRTGNNDLPMKGIPTQNTCKLNSGFTYEPKKFQRQLSKREGGAKLLDICELPQSLKKRRQQEMIEERKRKQEEKEIAKKKALEDKREREEAKRAAQQKLQESAKKPVEKKPRIEVVRNPSISEEGDKDNNSAVPSRPDYQTSEPSVSSNPNYPERMETHQPLLESQQEMPPQHDNYMNREPVDRVPHPSHSHARIMQNNPHPPHQQYVAHPVQNPSMVHRAPHPGYGANQIWVSTPVRDQRTPAQRAREAAIMNQCNEMLRNANSLDENGRQLVVAFMTGNKCNPRPELGHIITMKLSETIEDGLADNQMCKMKVETFFQMDYQSGEWKRLRKCRLLQPHELNNAGEQYMFVPPEDYHSQAQQQPT